MNADWQKELLARLPEPLRQDPKKAAILGGLGVVMVVVLLKQFVFSGTAAAAPALASAVVSVVSSSSSANRATGRGAAGSDDLAAARLSNAARSIQPVEQWLLEHGRPLERNPFEFHPEFFPNIDLGGASDAPTVKVVNDELFWDRLAKSLASQADQKRQRQIRIENLQVAAGKLRVQSTIMGANPRVLIGGTMNGVGDTVEAESGGVMLQFRIVRIEGRRIVLEREGVRLELPMGADRARVITDE